MNILRYSVKLSPSDHCYWLVDNLRKEIIANFGSSYLKEVELCCEALNNGDKDSFSKL